MNWFAQRSALKSSLGLSSLTSTQRYPSGAAGICGVGVVRRLLTRSEPLMPFLIAAFNISYPAQKEMMVAISDQNSIHATCRSISICNRISASSICTPSCFKFSADMREHVRVYRNRAQWLALAAEVALLAVPPARAQAKRAGQAATGGFAAFMESLILSALPDGNHGEIYGTGRAL